MLHLPCSWAPPLWGINMYIFCVNVRVPVQRSLGMRSNVVNISNESRSRVHGWWLNNIYLTAWPDRVWLEFNFEWHAILAFGFTGLFCVRHCSYVSRAYIAYWTPLTLMFTLFLCPNLPAISASASTDRWLLLSTMAFGNVQNFLWRFQEIAQVLHEQGKLIPIV